MRILIAVDGSTPSELARDLAAGIPWPPASTLRVVAALEIGGALFGAPWYAVAPANADELEQRYLQELGEYAAATATRLQERERSVQSAGIRGRAGGGPRGGGRRGGRVAGAGGAPRAVRLGAPRRRGFGRRAGRGREAPALADLRWTAAARPERGRPASAVGASVPHEVRAFGRRRDPGRP